MINAKYEIESLKNAIIDCIDGFESEFDFEKEVEGEINKFKKAILNDWPHIKSLNESQLKRELDLILCQIKKN